MCKSRKTVLVVDDDSLIRRIMHVRLANKFGYKVVEAQNGMSGLELANSILPDLILLDWNMPQMSGLDVIKKLRSTPKTGNIPVIMLTGRDLFGEMEDALAAGADGYVTKPVALNNLSRQIENALN